jgi:outer membrane protein OmpA-like peptidoglycan-associated protein
MRRSTLKLWLAATVIALGIVTVPAVKATSEDERPGEIGILAGVGFADQDLVGADFKTDVNPLIGGRFGVHFTDIVAGFFEMTYVSYKGDPALYGNVGEYSYLVGPEWYINHRAPWQFFINLGVGGVQYRTDFGGNDGRGFVSTGLGVRRGWAKGALRLETRVDHDVTSANGLGGDDFTTLKVIAGWTWGIGPRPKDTDGDGVFDKKDKCPDTPHGAIVDKVGCPKDSDGDGVWDGIDQCPDTPKGWPVDAKGCPVDTDGDGVVDGKDKCPNTTKGCTVNAEGCPADADGDGVCDGIDQCANTPHGARVDAKGCPMDSDGDGVPDGIDQCPNTPAGARVDKDGCPIEVTQREQEMLDKGVITARDIYFDTAKSTLKPESEKTLKQLCDIFAQWPTLQIEIGGHTDSRGSDAYNQKLSEDRAHAVEDWLKANCPNAKADNFTYKGYGESTPVATNKTAKGMAQNRRVEFKVMNPEELKRIKERREMLMKDSSGK